MAITGPRRTLPALLCALLAAAEPALAQPDPHQTSDDPIDAYARWVASQGVWKGPVTPFPERSPRPPSNGYVVASGFEPVVVHAPATLAASQVRTALADAEFALAYMRETGWAAPLPDGGPGGSGAADVYLVPGARPGASARPEGSSGYGRYDDALGFAVVDADASHPTACMVSALVQAGLLAQDPAESPRFRQATGAYVAYLATGVFGCEDAAVTAQQRAADGVLPDDEGAAAGGALLLALLGERSDGGTGAHVRELWQFARQRSQEILMLRASPNLWEVIERSMQNAGEDFEKFAIEFGVARYFAGPPGRRARGTFPALRMLPEDAAVPIAGRMAATELPRHLVLPEPVAPLGSAYVRVHVERPRPGQQIKIWLRGEAGPRWALSAVRLGAEGEELGRLHAPPRTLARGYLPLMLTEDTRAVLLVVTHLPPKLAELTRVAQRAYGAKLIVDFE